jgi:glycosyltransferase involved in cell wall biosynthesis
MAAWKGLRVLIEALSRLGEVPAWECWIAGGAQRPAETDYLETLRADAHRLGVSDRIQFLGQRSDVDTLLASADIFCQPNTDPEAFGISFVEALYASLPVVTCAMGGAMEIVDETCGVLVPPNDSSALADSIAGLLRDRDQRERLGRSGPSRARTLCDPERQMTALADLLDSVAAHRAAAHEP